MSELKPIPAEFDKHHGTDKPIYKKINKIYNENGDGATIDTYSPRCIAFTAAMRKVTGYDFSLRWSPGYNASLAIAMGVMAREEVERLALLMA